MFIPNDGITEIVAHFIGYFQVGAEDLRYRPHYDQFWKGKAAAPEDGDIDPRPLGFRETLNVKGFVPEVTYIPPQHSVATAPLVHSVAFHPVPVFVPPYQAEAASPAAPAGMAAVAGGPRELRVRYRVRECGLYGEAPFVDEWKPPLGARLHQEAVALRRVDLAPFAIDTEEVSVAAFAGFVRATGHRPARAERFPYGDLTGSALSDAAEAAATFVDLEDARAYARWRGARLPTEDEWQVAAEAGVLGRRPPVVWNLTESEHTDGRARFAILKGGSAYANARSPWFFDGGPQAPEWSAKLLLPAGGLARSAWIGFRCAVGLDAGR